MKKIVFFDVDGTLVNDNKEIPDSARKAVKDLQDKGVYVAIASGRAPFLLKDICEELNINSYVSFNGQYVVFEGEMVFDNPLPQASMERLIEVTEERDHPLVFMNEETLRTNIPDHHKVHEGMNSLKEGYPELDAEFYKGRTLYQCLLFADESHDAFYKEKFPEYGFLRWHDVSMDVAPANGSKAVGIREMLKRLDFKIEDAYAFGDGLNDIEMLQEVGTGVAMENGRDEVKAIADFVTDSVDNDGILKGLQRLGLL
ncbi:Cof-type HAD-IIB family hydrolase [Listeria rustica]|uniref:Cof-type HAD-IIB family hydrolase n=1 Tax=Listeria rustica TaxID=2713503 RepID=A0A7W1T803_9LIST|nr:Cof-type HAD-IIB family hydrolase [Listeria rustica]MBA3927144.1 Cof-type HAD-IIB family hydrolase [Listeria rustica]